MAATRKARNETMKPDDIANAITQALVQGGSQWVVSTITAFLPVLWTMTLILHLGRPYVLRILRRCGLRLGADIWWMSYLLMRDALILITFALSWIFFQPNIVASAALPITGPLSALLLLLALAVKLSRRVDDDIRAYRWLVSQSLLVGCSCEPGKLRIALWHGVWHHKRNSRNRRQLLPFRREGEISLSGGRRYIEAFVSTSVTPG